MGNRAEFRKPIEVIVRIFGTDRAGRVFSENVRTIEVSRSGIRIVGAKAQLKPGEIVGITYGSRKSHFRVKWAGESGTINAGQVGLVNLMPEREFWDFPLPVGFVDTFQPEARRERRNWTRVKCAIPVEVRVVGRANMWANASDISAGGCFVEMPIPLKLDSQLVIGLWLNDRKLTFQGSVASSAPGFGIGIRFENVCHSDRKQLEEYILALPQQR